MLFSPCVYVGYHPRLPVIPAPSHGERSVQDLPSSRPWYMVTQWILGTQVAGEWSRSGLGPCRLRVRILIPWRGQGCCWRRANGAPSGPGPRAQERDPSCPNLKVVLLDSTPAQTNQVFKPLYRHQIPKRQLSFLHIHTLVGVYRAEEEVAVSPIVLLTGAVSLTV